MKKYKPYFTSCDQRGSITGIFQNIVWKEINNIKSKKNVTRGDHYHKNTLEGFFVISGLIEIKLKNIQTGKKNEFVAQPHDIFVIEPYELHTFKCLKKSTWINLLSQPMDDKNQDIHKIT